MMIGSRQRSGESRASRHDRLIRSANTHSIDEVTESGLYAMNCPVALVARTRLFVVAAGSTATARVWEQRIANSAMASGRVGRNKVMFGTTRFTSTACSADKRVRLCHR